MENFNWSTNQPDQQSLVSSFLEIAVDQTSDIARQFLQATDWNLDQAIQLFFVSSAMDEHKTNGDDQVRAPLPVKREVLFERSIPYVGARPLSNSSVWEQDNLASLYRPPFALIFQGSFEKAKDFAKLQNKWLLLNIQSTTEFTSHMLNRDTWANEAVAETIKNNFIFWQIYEDNEEGKKICSYYKLDAFPVVLVIDPITGQNIRSWRGMVEPESLLEDILQFLDNSPTDHHVSLSHKAAPLEQVTDDEELQKALAISMEINEKYMDPPTKEKKANYPPLPVVEPTTSDKKLVCRVGIRLPDGQRFHRNFLRTDPIQLLWSFCYAQLKETEEKTREFRLTHAIPGSKPMDYNITMTFEDSGLANSMILVSWV